MQQHEDKPAAQPQRSEQYAEKIREVTNKWTDGIVAWVIKDLKAMLPGLSYDDHCLRKQVLYCITHALNEFSDFESQPQRSEPPVDLAPQWVLDREAEERTASGAASSEPQEWSVQEKPSGLSGIAGMPDTCLQICEGKKPVTHGLEVTLYNRALLDEAVSAHNAAIAAEQRDKRYWKAAWERECDLAKTELAAERERRKPLVEALKCAEYALTHPESDQAFALAAVRDAKGQAALAQVKKGK